MPGQGQRTGGGHAGGRFGGRGGHAATADTADAPDSGDTELMVELQQAVQMCIREGVEPDAKGMELLPPNIEVDARGAPKWNARDRRMAKRALERIQSVLDGGPASPAIQPASRPPAPSLSHESCDNPLEAMCLSPRAQAAATPPQSPIQHQSGTATAPPPLSLADRSLPDSPDGQEPTPLEQELHLRRLLAASLPGASGQQRPHLGSAVQIPARRVNSSIISSATGPVPLPAGLLMMQRRNPSVNRLSMDTPIQNTIASELESPTMDRGNSKLAEFLAYKATGTWASQMSSLASTRSSSFVVHGLPHSSSMDFSLERKNSDCTPLPAVEMSPPRLDVVQASMSIPSEVQAQVKTIQVTQQASNLDNVAKAKQRSVTIGPSMARPAIPSDVGSSPSSGLTGPFTTSSTRRSGSFGPGSVPNRANSPCSGNNSAGSPGAWVGYQPSPSPTKQQQVRTSGRSTPVYPSPAVTPTMTQRKLTASVVSSLNPSNNALNLGTPEPSPTPNTPSPPTAQTPSAGANSGYPTTPVLATINERVMSLTRTERSASTRSDASSGSRVSTFAPAETVWMVSPPARESGGPSSSYPDSDDLSDSAFSSGGSQGNLNKMLNPHAAPFNPIWLTSSSISNPTATTSSNPAPPVAAVPPVATSATSTKHQGSTSNNNNNNTKQSRKSKSKPIPVASPIPASSPPIGGSPSKSLGVSPPAAMGRPSYPARALSVPDAPDRSLFGSKAGR